MGQIKIKEKEAGEINW